MYSSMAHVCLLYLIPFVVFVFRGRPFVVYMKHRNTLYVYSISRQKKCVYFELKFIIDRLCVLNVGLSVWVTNFQYDAYSQLEICRLC